MAYSPEAADDDAAGILPLHSRLPLTLPLIGAGSAPSPSTEGCRLIMFIEEPNHEVENHPSKTNLARSMTFTPVLLCLMCRETDGMAPVSTGRQRSRSLGRMKSITPPRFVWILGILCGLYLLDQISTSSATHLSSGTDLQPCPIPKPSIPTAIL